MEKRSYKLIGGILLVSGTTIGAGMLALPVITGFAGFIPSVLLIFLFWIYMTYTALLFLEVNLAQEENTNLIKMAKKTLGKPGEWIAWIAYLFLLYSLTTAYLAGSGPIINDFVQGFWGIHLPNWVGALPLFAVFGYFVYRGTSSVDYVNRILMLGLAVAYFLMIIFIFPYVDKNLLMRMDSKYLLISIAIIATSFGFHIIIPSLTHYMERDVVSLRKALWIGGLIPLVVYLTWEFLTLGVIPLNGAYSISEGYREGVNGSYLLSKTLNSSYIALIARFFSFFAIVTSFLGVSLSLFDCLADSLHIEKTHTGRAVTFGLTFLPPLAFTIYDPRAFLTALEYAGAFGVVTLLGLLPALMTWSKRYYLNQKTDYQVKGGKWALILVILFSVCIMTIELANQFGYIFLEKSF
jgi:tyrosine-specific transport protein